MAKAAQEQTAEEQLETQGLENQGPDDQDWSKPHELDDIPPGDYLVEVSERTDPTKWFMVSREEGTGIPKFKSLAFQLEIIGGENEGRVIFHNVMFWGSKQAREAIQAKTGRPFDPRGFLDSFLVALGAAKMERKGAKRYITILPEFLEDGQLAPERFVGLQCMVKYGPDKSGGFMNVLKAWAHKEV